MSTAEAACRDIEAVDREWHSLKYMGLPQARLLHTFFHRHRIEKVLELGFFHGKSTAFMAAILEERGAGEIVTMDQESARTRTPPIDEVIGKLGLSHRVKPVYSHRSFTWELRRLLEQVPRPQFDFCYIDGAHTWDGTGFSFLLVDLLLKPGGWVVFDDLNWSIAKSPSAARNPKAYAHYSAEEQAAQQVRMVWDLLVPARGYLNLHEEARFNWGFAQKP